MTYNLSPEEMDKVRELVRLLTNATTHEDDESLLLNGRDEREAIRLAWQIKEFIQ